MTRILHIDTSGPEGRVVLAADGLLMAVRRNEQERDHAATISTMIAGVLEEGGIPPSGLNAVAVCTGPGSYTGLRIGMATAKGWCYALDIPLILHGRLELLQYDAIVASPQNDLFAAILPARAGEYFMSVIDRRSNILIPPGHFNTQEALQIFMKYGDKTCMVRGQWEDDLAVLSQKSTISYTNLVQPDIATWIRYTFDSWENNKFSDPARSEPDYLKSAFISSGK